jgi:HEAT repeat protein
MKAALLGLFALFAIFGACATEQPTVARSETSPVGHVEQQVRLRVSNLQNLQGAPLLASIETLIKCGALAQRPVIEGLDNSDPRVRASLVYVLGFIGGTEARIAVARRLEDTDAGVRYESAAALLQLGDVSGVPVLIQLLDNAEPRVRYKSMEAIAGLAGQNFGYEFRAAAEVRAAAVQRVRAWWTDRTGQPVAANLSPGR